MSYIGDIQAGDTIYFMWQVIDYAGLGDALTTFGGSVAVYKDDGTTEDSSGVTFTDQYDSKPGLCHVEIDTSADGTFFAAGHEFMVVHSAAYPDFLGAGTALPSTVIGQFSIENRTFGGASATTIAGAVWNASTTAYGATGSYGEFVEGIAVSATAIGEAVWNASTTAFGATGTYGEALEGVAFSSTAVANAVWNASVTGYGTTGTYGEHVEALTNFSATSVASELASYGVATTTSYTATLTSIGGAIAGLNNISATDVTAALTSYDVATTTTYTATLTSIGSAIAGLNDVSTAEVTSSAETALSNYGAATATSYSATLASIGSDVSDILTDTGTTIPNQISALNDISATGVSSAVWDVATTTYTSATGSMGELLQDIDDEVDVIHDQILTLGSIGSAIGVEASAFTLTTGTQTSGTYEDTVAHDNTYHVITASASGVIDCYYQFDLGETGVPTEVIAHGRLHEGSVPSGGDSAELQAFHWSDSSWDYLASATGVANSTSANDGNWLAPLFPRHVGTSASVIGLVRLRIYGTSLEAGTASYMDQIFVEKSEVLTYAGINAEVDTALADYDGPTHTELTTLIGTPADTDVSTDIANVQTAVDGLNDFDPLTDTVVLADSASHGGSSAVITLADPIDADVQEIVGNSGAANSLKSLTDIIVHSGTAQGGTNNTITLDAGASSIDGAYDPSMIYIVGGTGTGQGRNILEYNGTTKVAVVDRSWKVNPDATSDFVIQADAGREHVNEGLAQGGAAGSITLNALASSSDDSYVGQTVFIRSGTGEDQCRFVTAYNGTTKVATVDHNWDVNPDATSGYVMLPTHIHQISEYVEALLDEPLATYTATGSVGEALGVNIPLILGDTDEIQSNALGTDSKVLISTDAQDLSATLDVNTKTITGGAISATVFAANAITDAAIASDAEIAIANAVHAVVVESNGSVTQQQAMSIILSAVAGVTTTQGTVFKDSAGTATRITAVVNALNERTSISLSAST